ncbi:MAG: type IX secretion system membrane protein PorP/SprF [Odoribacter sp.]|nr:type IX secretion system membrane protein PorP/SprF [Odoribacter sp.]
MKIVLILLLVLTTFVGYAQNTVLTFTDYSASQPLINPAAMGHESGANGLLLYHSRFEKSDYWPSTAAFNINSMLTEKNFGGGLSAIFDKYGPYQKLFLYVAGTYKLKVNEGKNLYFGLQAGVNYVSNAGDYKLVDDETIFTDNYSQPNFGFGLHFETENYFIGASIPEFRYNTLDELGEKISETASEMMRIYLYGGFRFKVGKTTRLMPYAYMSYSEYESAKVDLGAKLLLRDAFEFGLQYRTKEAFGVLVRVRVFDGLWLGYAFEGNSADVGSKFNTNQEIGLSFHFGKKGKKSSSTSEEEKVDDSINSIRYF